MLSSIGPLKFGTDDSEPLRGFFRRFNFTLCIEASLKIEESVMLSWLL